LSDAPISATVLGAKIGRRLAIYSAQRRYNSSFECQGKSKKKKRWTKRKKEKNKKR
jgi:hypothetical protein